MTKLKTINIKGKEYVQVHERILAFHDLYPKGSITSKYELHGNMWIVVSTVTPDTESPSRVFTGMAQEIIGEGMVNKTSSLENAETSAVGRALGMLGIGILEGVASADEVVKANNRAETQDFEAQGLIRFNPPYTKDKDKFKKMTDFLKQNGGKFDGEKKCWWISQELATKLENKLNPQL